MEYLNEITWAFFNFISSSIYNTNITVFIKVKKSRRSARIFTLDNSRAVSVLNSFKTVPEKVCFCGIAN